MDCLLTVLVALLVTIGLTLLLLLSRAKKACPAAKLPPGSLGLPVVGHTIVLLRAMRANTVDRFIQDRIDRYGAVSKLSLFGSPTVLLAGPAGNKFTFFSRSLTVRQPRSARRILGETNILALRGKDHRRIRVALLLEFLTPDMLKTYVGRIDAMVTRHLEESWACRTAVTVMPLMKRLTFDIMTALVVGNIETGAVRGALDHDLEHILEGVMTIPVNLPFTAYRRALKASRRARRLLDGIMREKKARLELELEQGDDLISRLLSKTDDHGEQVLTNEEIVDNSMAILVAGRDATAILITFMIRQLADDPDTLAVMVQEHEEIARNKADGDALTWEDLLKMKLTWRVAQETLRVVPPFFGSMRTALEDMEFEGYRIPKGWQVFWAPSVTHMDPSIFHDPARFDPSRFENHSTTAPRCSFVAFGGGPRICAGIDFAKMETLVIMHNLVRRFRWKLCCKDNTFVMDPLASPLHGLPIHLEHYRASV